MNKEPCVLSW